MTDPVAARLALAETVAAEAGALATRFFEDRDALVVEAKASPQDIVSRADREVEDLIRARILSAFPEDGVLGEEGGMQPGKSGYTWVLDPIDGTSPFLAGLPHWCVVIAVQQGDETVVGVIAHPSAGEMFTARREHGAYLNGQRLGPRRDLRIDNSLVAIGASHRTAPAHVAGVIGALMERGGIFYRNGSGAIMIAAVAAGRLGGYYEPHMNPWDCLAGLLMVREAGGRTLPFPAGADGGPVMATAPAVWEPLTTIVALAPADKERHGART
ncbi:inositol monophosphatase [Aureimonas sp. SA4125]|uniref:inositol monophosphatase family protein n=1 Tax=Aureimonas sp. SA4125 TaxID=2826993 RepID=UPI001CC7FFBD|nr:inositol monophosphatase family protein [Aureimonas sp. SA4125]BDA84332.1 inositol monophosphatase [Aureimonas sp. SA4125]